MKKILIFIFGLIIYACDSNPIDEEVDCALTDLSLKVTKVQIADCGLQNGEITIEATGGTPPYQYNIENFTTQESNVFKGLGPPLIDPYTFFVTDNNGCTQSATTFLGQRAPFTATITVTYSGCEGDSATITAVPFNGVPPYTYQLGENSQYQDENYWENLLSGTYSVWIKDASHCFMGITDIAVTSGVSYSESISSIISTNCALPDCHGGTQTPDFRVFSNIQANAEKIRTLVQDKSEPREGSLTEEEIKLIICWVNDGAPDN